MYALALVHGGIVADVRFLEDPDEAVEQFDGFVKTMDPEKDDAIIFSERGCYQTAKAHLDEMEARGELQERQ